MEHTPEEIIIQETNLNTFKKTAILSSIFSDNTMRLEINYILKKKTCKAQTYRLNNMLLKNTQWITEQVKEEF